MELIGKISPKNCSGNIKQILKEMKEGQTQDILQVIGIAKGTIEGESDFGPYTGFKGQFKAKNLLDGREFMSGKCFLPDVATDLIAAQFADDIKEIQFAFIVGVKAVETSSVGYEYYAKPLTEPKENDPLALLERNLLPHKK